MSRFKVTRFDGKPKKIIETEKERLLPIVKKVIKAEDKVISKVKKKARLEHISWSEIHSQLTLYAMREHLRQCLKDVMKNKSA